MKLLRRFEENSKRHPSATALLSGGAIHSYEWLDKQSDLLAAEMRNMGVGPNTRVAIQMEKGPTAIVAIMAVLRADGAYCPIDPRLPPARRRLYRDLLAPHFVFDDSGLTRTTDIPLGNNPTPTQRASDCPEHPAYCLFTSGSSGTPKCVEMPRRSLDAFVKWSSSEISLSPGDRIAATAPLSFDLSTFDVFSTLASGASLALYGSSDCSMPGALARRMCADRVTVWYTTPFIFRQISKASSHPPFRAVILAGDRFPTEAASGWKELHETEFWNWYGPTETNVCSAYRVPNSPQWNEAPIGRAVGAASVELFCAGGKKILPQAQEIGEICVSGECLMLGYRTGANLTPPEPSYRTGDYGRWLSDGNMEFLGRRDDLIKVHGHRTSLTEIENALLSLPEVLDAAVVAITESEGTAQLGALVVPRHSRIDRAFLLRTLLETLPPHMLPTIIEFSEEIPRGENGKVVRQRAITALKENMSRQ